LLDQTGGEAVVEVTGVGPLRARADGQHAPGAEAVLTVRPEKIVFGEIGDAAANALDATIESVVFVGDAYRYEARLGGGQSIVLKRPHRAGIAQYARGEQARVAWCVADGRLV